MKAGIIFVSIALGWFIINWIVINRMLLKKQKVKKSKPNTLLGFRRCPML